MGVWPPYWICHQVVLKRSIINSAKDGRRYPHFQDRIARHKTAHPDDPIPIPFDDLEPQVYIPYSTPSADFPWHVQIHRDAFSYGDLGPTVDPRIIVDLRFFGRSELNRESRVVFAEKTTPPSQTEWGGDTDIFGMPQPTVRKASLILFET
jgi:pyranose oxidase